MRVKIDENLSVDVAERFRKAGFDAETVYSEGIEGCSDVYLITVCKKENRVLVTLDNHFSNIKWGSRKSTCCFPISACRPWTGLS